MFGGHHWHPQCRPQYQERLCKAVEASGQPAFVAVEWDSGIVNTRGPQRTLYRTKWSASRPQDPPEVVDLLTFRLAWESDSHASCVPDAPIVYLDEGRDPAPSGSPFGSNRLIQEQLLIGPNYKATPTDEVLPQVCAHWEAESAAVERAIQEKGWDPTRDRTWHGLIRDASSRTSGDWAVVTVGALHASRISDETLYCLLHDEFDCSVEYLAIRPAAAVR